MLACMLSAAILSYGGINSFVIIFAVYPIALKLFEEADLPTYLLPAIVCAGMWTFAMTGPFTPQIPNVVSMEYLGTPAYAGLVPGLAGAASMFIGIIVYMNRQGKKAKLRGEHFQWPEGVKRVDEKDDTPSGIISLIPIAFVLLIFNLTKLDIIICLLLGILLALALFWKYLPKEEMLRMFNDAAVSSITIIMNTAAIVGVGILGSASGGISLVYETLGDTFNQYAAQGYNLGFIHRLCADGCGGLDSVPWNGSIVSVFAVCHATHKQSYKYNFVSCLVIPLSCTMLIALPLCILLG